MTSEGETAKCKKVVCDPSYLPDKVTSSNVFDTNKLLFSAQLADTLKKQLHVSKIKAN